MDGQTDERRTDAGAWVYYKLTYEPKAFGSGELKIWLAVF